MDNDAIVLSDLRKSYGKKEVLKGLSMRVKKGSIYAFLGRNGEGKTTTMRLLLDMLHPKSGTIEVLGEPPRNNPSLRKRIGFVPERPVYYEWMRVSEIFSLVRGAQRDRWDEKYAEELLSAFSIPREKIFGSLSAGMKAKVALTAALGHRPELLLLDDPISGLDAVVRREFLETLVDLAHGGGCTIFFSSHIVTELERVAEDVGLLLDGRLAFQCSLEELKKRTRRVRLLFTGGSPPDLGILCGERLLSLENEQNGVLLTLREADPELLKRIENLPGCRAEFLEMDLEEIFVAWTRDRVTQKNDSGKEAS
ncbi:MAG: ABC transporter ATP-binding protein [bacterium]